jgi:hypothetical protein
VRLELWGGAFSAEVPEGWDVVELDDVIEIESKERRGSSTSSGRGRGAADDTIEQKTSYGFAARSSIVEQAARWDVGAGVSARRAVVYSYNDDGARDETRAQASVVFQSIVVA